MTIRYRSTSLLLALVLTCSLGPVLTPVSAQDLGDFERARALRVQSLLHQGPGALSIAGPAAKPAGLAADGGAITGTVRGLDPEGLESAAVMAWPADSVYGADGESLDIPSTTARARVLPDGTYRLEGLSPGPYYVSAVAKGYETRYYEDTAEQASATVVDILDEGIVEGIDFAMVRIGAGEGSIAGTVTAAADGHPIAGAFVHAFTSDDRFGYGMAETDGDGRYLIEGLRSGRYVVEVVSPDYLPQFYGDATAYDEAILVQVTEPGRTEGIDFGLAVGGSITGVVVDAGGSPLAGVYVNAIVPLGTGGPGDEGGDPDGRLTPVASGGWAVTDALGFYRLGGLSTGEYRVQAQYSTRWQYMSVWYDGVEAYDQATPVQVVMGQETAAIDMALLVPVMNSGVAGRVTDGDGRPVVEAFVTVQEAVDWARVDSLHPDETGASAGSAGSGVAGRGPEVDAMPGTETVMIARAWAYAVTDKDGRYAVDELPAGTYIVSAMSSGGWEQIQRWYVDAATPEDAAELVLGEGERRSDIDIVLPLRAATASLSGTIRDQDGTPLSWAFVEISPVASADASTRGDGFGLWAYGQTDSAGAYRVDRLPAGTYTVHGSYNTGELYGHSWFDGAPSPDAATPLVLADGESRTGIDLQLVVRPLYGVVTGTVTDASSGAPVERAYVELSPLDRDVRMGAPLRYWAPAVVTDASGAFRLDWIPEGVYSLTVYANGAAAHYVHPDTDALSTPFEVRGGETTRCDVALAVRHDGEGVITGTVTATFGGPLFGGYEPRMDTGATPAEGMAGGEILPVNGAGSPEVAVVVAQPVASPGAGAQYIAVTAPDGAYALRGLAPGDYVIMCFAPGHIGTYYGGSYAPDKARTVHVDGEQPVEGIDFDLAASYRYYALEGDEAGDGSRAPAGMAAANGPAVYGNVADDAGHPVANATVYLLDDLEQPVAFAQTGGDGSFELAGIAPGQYRLYASRLGFTGSYNGGERDFAAAQPFSLAGGQTEVNLILSSGRLTAVTEDTDAQAAVPSALVLHQNWPNPFNPETRIAFAVPRSGPATVRVHNALGQLVATLFDQVAEAGQPYEVTFRPNGLGAGTYYYSVESQGQRLALPMALVK